MTAADWLSIARSTLLLALWCGVCYLWARYKRDQWGD